ncbi:hypothetical protein QTI66_32810 [Variovorax sp. J22R133]|uniref:hypothetical protein n=1 Tax=Variovorax brevis TaxID=3053503 RepID=UPI002578E189|nr:hypothetical protein [Variovorax sp. J22R133]MDM0116910.1 hypothetical protein [Variovorax sp. J22R133]
MARKSEALVAAEARIVELEAAVAARDARLALAVKAFRELREAKLVARHPAPPTPGDTPQRSYWTDRNGDQWMRERIQGSRVNRVVRVTQ